MALCLLALGAWPKAAHAAKPTKEELRAFKKLVKEGSKLRDEGEHWKALDKFEEARQILDHPKLAFNIGKLHQKTGACAEAKDLYTNVLGRRRLPDDLRVEVVAQLKTADQCKSFGTLSVACVPSNTTIQVAGENLSCPFRKKITPGKLRLVARAPEYESRTISVSIEPGQLVRERIRLDKAEGGAQAQVSAGDSGEGPSELDDPAEVGEPTPWMTYAAYGSMGVGTGLLIGGIISDYSAQSRAEEFVAANNAGDRDRAQALKSEADSAQVRTVVLYSAGAVLVGGGVALWAFDTQQESEGAVVSTEVGWGPAGPTVRGVLSW